MARDFDKIRRVLGDGTTVALAGSASSMTGLLLHRLVGDPRVRTVVLVDRDPVPGMDPSVRYYSVDLSQPGSEERIAEILSREEVGVVVHLGLSTELSRTPDLDHEMDTQGTMHLMSSCTMVPVRKIVLASTTMLYGAHPDNSPWLAEDHELRADRTFPFFGDKIEAERQFVEFAHRHDDRVVTILRVGLVLGPNTKNVFSHYLARRIVPVLAGFDPPMQLVHEVDAVRAFLMVITDDHPGVFNIVADAVVPLATAIRIVGHAPLPVVEPLASPVLGALWSFGVAGLPGPFIPYLKYPFLASGERAASRFGFTASFPPVEVLGDFARAQKRRRIEAGMEEA